MDDLRLFPATQVPIATTAPDEPFPGFGPNYAVFDAWMTWAALPATDRPAVAPGENPAGLQLLPLPPSPVSEAQRRFEQNHGKDLAAWAAWEDNNQHLFDGVFDDPIDDGG